MLSAVGNVVEEFIGKARSILRPEKVLQLPELDLAVWGRERDPIFKKETSRDS